jgi:RNA polymerase sigma factor (sigma-70 family)
MATPHGDAAGQSPRSDPVLIAAVRAGDAAAYETLYHRHVAAARRLASALTSHPSDAGDLVAEAFARLLSTLRAGGGPDTAFRVHLLTTVRNRYHQWARRQRRLRGSGDPSGRTVAVAGTAVEGLERTLVARAFARLPEQWQTILWHTEVDRENPATVAGILGLAPTGVTTPVHRARERLRQNYLREHATTPPVGECLPTIDRLGTQVRHGLPNRDRAAVDDHLSQCRRCQVLYLELGDAAAGLGGVLAPAVLGGSAAADYLGSVASTSRPGGLLSPLRNGAKQIAHRRSTHVGAAGVAVAAMVALALVLTPSPAAKDPPIAPGPRPAPAGSPPGWAERAPGGAQPPLAGPPLAEPSPDGAEPLPDRAAPPAGPDARTPAPPVDPGPDYSVPGDGLATPAPPRASPTPDAVPLAVSLESVGALVRGRPGVLVLTVAAVAPGGPGPPETGSGTLTAKITVPAGVRFRAGDPGDGWSCAPTGRSALRCRRPSWSGGATTQAFVPVDVAAAAAAGRPRVRLTGPGFDLTATATSGIQADGRAAGVAGPRPAPGVTGGDSLVSCAERDLRCRYAPTGSGGGGDNDYYAMKRYVDAAATDGYPFPGAVSGATIQIPGKVRGAGLF